MSTELRINALRVSLVAGILSVAISAAAQTAPVIYQGLRHTPIGNAVLQLDSSGKTLDVNTTDPNGGDGVAVDLGGTATSWSAQIGTTADPSLSLGMTWHAIADGQRISSAFLRQTDNRVALSARFTGSTTPTYAVQVYDNGRLVDAVGGVPPSAHIFVPIWLPCEFLEHGCSFVREFHNNPNGECQWDIVFRRTGPITLPNGVQAIGNQVRMVEEVKAGEQYPYVNFHAVTMQTNARVLTLFAESAR